MKKLILQKVRLSYFFLAFFCLFSALVILLPKYKLEGGALALFSVNSFLYGFYIAPVLSAQRARIEELHKIVRAESNAVFAMALSLKKLPKPLRNEIQDMLLAYLKTCIEEQQAGEGEEKYEALISFCIEYKGSHDEEVDKFLEKIVANQQNRTNFSMQMNNAVFSNEWMIMSVLFGITLTFILIIDTGSNMALHFLAALLCTGLTMLILILVKLSTLTHKKARKIWDPYQKLIDSHFYRID